MYIFHESVASYLHIESGHVNNIEAGTGRCVLKRIRIFESVKRRAPPAEGDDENNVSPPKIDDCRYYYYDSN